LQQLRVYNSLSGTTQGIGLTRPSAHAYMTCRIGLLPNSCTVYSPTKKLRFGAHVNALDLGLLEQAYNSLLPRASSRCKAWSI